MLMGDPVYQDAIGTSHIRNQHFSTSAFHPIIFPNFGATIYPSIRLKCRTVVKVEQP